MTHEEQVNTLKKAFDLQTLIIEKQNEFSLLSQERYKEKPLPPSQPQKPVYDALPYPEIKSDITFTEYLKTEPTWLLCLVFWPYILYLYFKGYKNAKAEDVERKKQSEEYRIKCKEVDEENFKRDAIAENELKEEMCDYNAKLENYNTVIVPQYEEELRAWTDNHNKQLNDLNNVVEKASDELTALYDETNILPLQYRNIEAIEYVYNIVASSNDYDVFKGIESYEKKLTRDLETERIKQQEKANDLAMLNAQLANEQNEFLAEQNTIAERARKDARNAEIVGAIQRHNTNKILKDRRK